MIRLGTFFPFWFFAFLGISSPALAGPIEDCASQIPYGAPAAITNKPTTVVCHRAYLVGHDDQLKVPRWVAWVETGPNSMGCHSRPGTNAFKPDPELPKGRRAEPSDYSSSGYDRGHMASNADMAWDPDVVRESFLLSNIAPQLHGFNAGIWEVLERDERIWATDRGEVAILAGPIFDGAPQTIGPDKVGVPSGFFKVIVDPKTSDTLAFLFPHEVVKGTDLRPFLTSIGGLEVAAGMTIPVPHTIDRTKTGELWPADQKAWAAKKTAVCQTD